MGEPLCSSDFWLEQQKYENFQVLSKQAPGMGAWAGNKRTIFHAIKKGTTRITATWLDAPGVVFVLYIGAKVLEKKNCQVSPCIKTPT